MAGQPKEKEKTNGLVGAKKQGSGRANLRKKEKTNGLVGAKNREGEGQPKEKRGKEWISRG